MSTAIPRMADDLTPAWCSEALGRSITDATAVPMGVGVGLVGQLFRLDVDGPDGSQRLVAKLAAPTDESRFVATVLNMYGREVGFYTELSAGTPIRHPQCHFAAHDPETQDTVLLLEDVSGCGHALDQVVGATVDEARPAIRTLARLHAAYWDERGLDDAEWLPRLSDDPYPGSVAFAYETAWPRVQELFADDITPRVREFGDSYSERIPALFAKLSEPPVVLAHADWRLDNLFFTPDGEVVALETYLSDLRELGVDPDDDWAWEMYRYGTMLGFVYPVVAAGALTIEDPRHVELTHALLVRSVRALDELDAFDLPL